ncbi:LysM peptidoglycan-binding domain-containing protein [Salmonella enterica subsp. houtenae serovar 17:z29:-]|nr:LysM peptidoglycan-binding domain-containing protein [Salmonella enterica subsp. houtenae serovar 17:z29:-]
MGSKSSRRKGIPVTEHSGKSSGKSHSITGKKTELSPPKKSATPSKKLSPLEQWKAGRKSAIGNSDWYIYDDYIKKLVSEINQHLSTSKNIKGYKTLDWKLIKAMIWTETSATSAEWKKRTMQIGNTGDDGIKEVSVPARPRKYNLIIPKTWNSYLINKTDLIRSNPEYNIRAGISLLMIKMAEQEKDRTVYESETEFIYEVVKGDLGYSSIAKKTGTTQGVLTQLNGNKTIHPRDKLKYKKAHIEQYIPGWTLFTPQNIQIQYNGDPKKATADKPGDGSYADKIKYAYELIIADESRVK